jgi:two-component system response regulator PilR (NtrC family)
MSRILVVDDEPAVLKFLGTILARDGHEVLSALSGADALRQLKATPCDLLLTDHNMDPMDGVELLIEAQRQQEDLPVVLISGYGTVNKAVDALKAGAFDYLPKPVKVPELLETVRRALEFHDKLARRHTYRTAPGSEHALGDLIAYSPAMAQVCEMIRRVAATDLPVLVLGEGGVGKKLVARTIHGQSRRAGHMFVQVDCAHRPESELEALLFHAGSREGRAGTAAQSSALVRAAGGTLFLAEVGSLPLGLQERLASVLSDSAPSDDQPHGVRMLASSRDPLIQMMEKGTFREDLYRRLGILPLRVPPLRERPEDILPLAFRLLQKMVGAGQEVPRLSADVELLLSAGAWPGNGAELQKILSEALPHLRDGMLDLPSLPARLLNTVDMAALREQRRMKLGEYRGLALKNFLAEKERQYLQSVMTYVKDDPEEAARKLNISAEVLARHLSNS